MADLNNTNTDDTGFFTLAAGTTNQRPSSPTIGMTRFNYDISIIEFYGPSGWQPISFDDFIANSALEIKNTFPDVEDGVYTINLPTVGPTPIYCIMDDAYDGGGWMLALKATRGSTFQYTSSYWTNNNTLNTDNLDRSDADAKFDVFNYYEGTDLFAYFPDIGDGGSISGLGNWTWLENNFPQYIGETTSTLVNLFNTANRTFIQDAKQFSGYGSAWSSQSDVRFYGFNFVDTGNNSFQRWGFGWNENGGGLFPGGNENSADVAGGIGFEFRGLRYSAGDRIECCQDSSGINRSARVEVYVR